jgi:hypothetical protein
MYLYLLFLPVIVKNHGIIEMNEDQTYKQDRERKVFTRKILIEIHIE